VDYKPTVGTPDDSPFDIVDKKTRDLLLALPLQDSSNENEPCDRALAMRNIEILCGFRWNPQHWDKVEEQVSEICKIHGNRIATAESATFRHQTDPALYTRDIEGVHRTGSLASYITERQLLNTYHGFNINVCNDMFTDDIEYSRLAALATHGAYIDVAKDFIPCSEPETMRSIWSELPNTLSWHVNKLWQSNKIIVLPIDKEILAYNPHISPLWWVEQDPVTKPQGRFLGDLTNRETGHALNTEEAKDHIKERYGELNHPTIIHILISICIVAQKCGGFRNIRLWKEDITGAFTHFFYNPEQARLLSFAISVTHILIFIMGMFGWSGSPYVFGVFSRALLRYILVRIKGQCHCYCDDFIGVSHKDDALSDSEVCQGAIERCFGKDTAAKDKRVPPCLETDAIGWQINLVFVTIRPNYKGIKSLTRAFCIIKPNEELTTKQFQMSLFNVFERHACVRATPLSYVS